jgi:hypothetical protein
MSTDDLKIPDTLIMPLVRKYNIEKEEAEKRFQLLYKTSILKVGNPNDIETQHMIDDFLSKSSEESAELVLFEKTLDECLVNKDFVKQYDRLSNTNFTKCLREMNEGNPPSNVKKQFSKFSTFVRETVFQSYLNSINNLNSKKQ